FSFSLNAEKPKSFSANFDYNLSFRAQRSEVEKSLSCFKKDLSTSVEMTKPGSIAFPFSIKM
uniref:hypothetical protein n=1 Tax=Zunongwangia profunda TaxID=398743 RepID=UPI002355157F